MKLKVGDKVLWQDCGRSYECKVKEISGSSKNIILVDHDGIKTWVNKDQLILLDEAEEADLRVLPTDSKERKDYPMFSGGLEYFPAAFAGLAKHSKDGNDKHNAGQPLHHARGKSSDHADCIMRHLTDFSELMAKYKRTNDQYLIPKIVSELDALFWRSGALNQVTKEQLGLVPMASGARL